MRKISCSWRGVAALAIVAGASFAAPVMAQAARPVVARDEGAFVRIVGNPLDGTIKFQYGWNLNTAASDAVGYWVGVYDVTHSHYVWSSDTGAIDLPNRFKRNAHPTSELANGDYKIVFFVRQTYGTPTTNISEIELPFTVNYMED